MQLKTLDGFIIFMWPQISFKSIWSYKFTVVFVLINQVYLVVDDTDKQANLGIHKTDKLGLPVQPLQELDRGKLY